MSDFLNEYRVKNPAYRDLDDSQLATALHAKYNADTGANLAVEDFNAAIGLVSEPAAQPALQGADLEPPAPMAAQTEITAASGRAPEEKSMFELISDKLGNLGAGAAERAGDLGGALFRAAQIGGEWIESKTRHGGLIYDDGDLSYYAADEYEKINPPTIVSKGADVLQGIDLGYEENSNWEGVKKAFTEGGPLSGSAYAEVLEYGIEQGVKSVPDMVAVIYSLPAYIVARSGEIGEARAKNKGKEKTELVDILEAAPAAVASALLERVGAKGMTSGAKEVLGKEMLKAGIKESAKRVAKAGGKALAKEAATEAFQEGMIEYVGERFGTDKAMDFGEALDRAAGAAVAGGVFGGAIGGATATGAEINYNPEKLLGKELAKEVEKAELPSAEAAAREALSPDKAQMEVVKEPVAEPIKEEKKDAPAAEPTAVEPVADPVADAPVVEPAKEPVAEERKAARILTDEEPDYLPAPEPKTEAKPDYGTDPVNAYNTFNKKVGDQTATAEEIKADADNVVKNKDSIIATFSERKVTKAALQQIIRSPRTDWTKPQMVNQAYEQILQNHIMADSVVLEFMGTKTIEEQYIDIINKQTQENVEAAYERQREERAKRLKFKEDTQKALDNPETLIEYSTFIRARGKSKLTAKQLATYDELVAETMREEDKPKTVKGEAAKFSTTRAQTVHSKTGEDIFIVKMVERVERDKFTELKRKAKEFGGWYSTFAKAGAIPGWQFKTLEAADQFEELLAGKDVDKSDFTEAKAEVKQSKNAQKLLDMAATMEAKATEELSRDRLANTAKRAGQAATAIERAQNSIAFAKTLRQIAVRLQEGGIVHLGKISQATQLEQLQTIQRQAIPLDLYDRGPNLDRRELKTGVTLEDYIGRVEMPEAVLYRGNAGRLIDKLKEAAGFKQFAKELVRIPIRGDYKPLDPQHVQKIKEAVKKGVLDKYEVSTIIEGAARVSRLNRLGITSDEQLRAAIRELDSLTVEKQKEDPVKKLERDLIGKKIAGYFPTPKELVNTMLDYADIQEGHEVLEPSAGKGNIAAEIMVDAPNAILEVLEIDSGLRSILEAKGYKVVGNDFLDHTKKYDRIVMNPPFESFQDIDHVKHAYDLLKPGGKLVAIMGAGVKNSRSKAVEFRQWLDDKGSYIEDNPDGSFKSSERPTGVSTVMVTIDKNDTNTTDYKKADTKKAPEQQGPKVFNAPGHNYVGLYRSIGIPPRKALVSVGGNNIKMPKNPQRIEPIRRMITKIAGRRIYYAKIKGKSREGFYRPSTGEIRTRRKNDVEVLAHELAHYLDSYSNVTLPNFKKLYREAKYANEINGLSYTDADKQVQKIEGFAEFVRLWLTNEVEAQRRAPTFYAAFNEQLVRDKKLSPKMLKTQELMHKFYFQGPDKLGQALIGQSQSFRQTFEEWAYRRDSLIRQQVVDRFHAARKIEQELTGKIGTTKESAWKQLRISNGGAEGIADFILNFGTVQFDAKGDLKPNGKSLHDVLEPVKTIKVKPEHRGVKKIDLLMRYFAGRRALELHRQGRENLIPKETAMEWARLGGEYKVFETIHKDYQAFNGRMMDFYEEAGMITPEGREIMQTMNQNYVPFNRIRDSLVSGKGAGGGFHKLKGGTANLNDILINIQDGITANVRAALNNRAKQRLYGYISGHKDGAIFATRISPDSKKVGVYEEEMRAKIEKILIENGIMDDDGVFMTDAGTAIDKENLLMEGKDLLTFWQHGVKPQLNESGNVVDQVIINGKPRYYEVQDPLLQDMLLSMNPESYSTFMSVMFGFKNFFTRMITLGVEFTGANLVRDTAGSAVLSKNKFKPFYDSFKGMYSFIAKDEHYKAFIRSGGGHSSRIEGMTTAGKARRRVKLQEFGVMTATQQLLTNIDNIMSAFEYGTRIGEFRMAKKNSASDMDAGFQAREISTDFSVTGSNRFITGAIRTVPFLNAMIQSQDRMYREMLVGKKYDGNPLGVAMKGFLGITIPTLILYMVNRDDEDYQQIPDYEKRTNWHIKIGNKGFIKIPRPYDIGFSYATMPELFFKYVEDDKGREFADGLMWTITQMYGVDATPAMMQGWWDIVRNEKWTGAPVVPRSLEDVEASEQYTSNTSETFIRLGEALGVSPVEAEHLFKAYTGYLGGYLMAATDHMLWDEDKFGDKPDAKLSDNIFLKRFLTSEVRHSTAFMEKFFDLKEKSDKLVATFKQSVDARRLLAEKGESAGKFRDDRFFGLSAEEKKVLFGLNDSMNQLIKAIYGREGLKTAEIKIKLDKNLSGAEKRIKLDESWRVRNKAFMTYYNKAEAALEKAREKGPKNED